MNGKIRTGLFPHERAKKKIRFNVILDWKGMFDPRLGSDCRCYNLSESEISPWAALNSLDNWDQGCITPQELPDGETGHPEELFIPIEDIPCDIFGKPLLLDINDYWGIDE